MGLSIVEPIYTRQDERGLFQEVIRGKAWRTVIVGHMRSGSEMGHHYHRKTQVYFHITSGAAKVSTEDVETGDRDQLELSSGQGVLLEPKQSHVIRFTCESDFLMLKSLGYDPENPDTIQYLVSE
jgi:dTDP-4-dehydrorhamnose 3,5-epimerase-like enzyme